MATDIHALVDILPPLELQAPQAVSHALLAHLRLPLTTHAAIALLELQASPRLYPLLLALHAPLENTALAHLVLEPHILKVVRGPYLIQLLLPAFVHQAHTALLVAAHPYNAL